MEVFIRGGHKTANAITMEIGTVWLADGYLFRIKTGRTKRGLLLICPRPCGPHENENLFFIHIRGKSVEFVSLVSLRIYT